MRKIKFSQWPSIISFLLISCCHLSISQHLEVLFQGLSKSDFTITVNGEPWLEQNLSNSKSEISVTAGNQRYSTADQSLVLDTVRTYDGGRDILGSFRSHVWTWNPTEIGFETELRIYAGKGNGGRGLDGDLLVFTQRFQVIEMNLLAR